MLATACGVSEWPSEIQSWIKFKVAAKSVTVWQQPVASLYGCETVNNSHFQLGMKVLSRWKACVASFVPGDIKGPLLCPLSDLYVSSRTPAEEPNTINRPPKLITNSRVYLDLRLQHPAKMNAFFKVKEENK